MNSHLTIEQFGEFFDIDDWLGSLIYPRAVLYFEHSEIEKRIGKWIEVTPLVDVPSWENFCRRRCRGETKAAGLLAVGKRIAALNPRRAVDVLCEAWKSYPEFFFTHGHLAREICSKLMELDPEKGRELLLESFRQQYQRYPESIVYSLDKLLEFSRDFPAFDPVRLYEIWSQYNSYLVAGLSSKAVDTYRLTTETNSHFDDHCLRYLLGLFDYPVVDIRRLALEELFRLIEKSPGLLKSILDNWIELTNGQKEHVASLLFSMAITNSVAIQLWGPRIVELGQNENHYNLRATIAEAVQAAVNNGAEIDLTIVSAAQALKSQPRLIVPPSPPLHAAVWNSVTYPPYLRWSLDLIADAARPGAIDAATRRYLSKLYPQLEHGCEEEATVHRRYNINTNFDRIEISGNYDRAVRESINLALHELAQSHSVDSELLGEVADVLRIYDPSDLLVRRVSRPAEITWIDQTLSDEQFVEFTDIHVIRERLLQRDRPWITLYENTEQRTGDRFGSDLSRATKVRVTAFGVTPDGLAPTLDEIEDEARGGALTPLRNRYRFELARTERAMSYTLRPDGKQLVPLVQVSRRSFRGRNLADVAAFVPAFARDLHLKRGGQDILGYNLGSEPVVRSIDWQEAFDQGRRRHEPKSLGFLLQMDRELLSQLSRARRLEIWAYLVTQRTTDKYRPETEMNWHTHSEVFPLVRA